jgi:hypothetical protein
MEEKESEQAPTEDGAAALDVPQVVTTAPSRGTSNVEPVPVPLPEGRDELDGLKDNEEGESLYSDH